jgi:2-iminoacetate synthase ThiH
MCKFYCKFCDFGTKELNNEQWRTLKSINQEQNELTKKNIWFGLLRINRLTKIKETHV